VHDARAQNEGPVRASYNGINCAPVCPLQAASVERGVCTPERALICSCR
jgi:hypothetical protein